MRNKKGKKRQARQNKREKGTEQIKIVYANVQGKVNKTRTETWREIEKQCNENEWDVMAFTETHWRIGAKNSSPKKI